MITNLNQNNFAKNEVSKDIKDKENKEKLDKKNSLNPKEAIFLKDEIPQNKLPKDYVSKIEQKLQDILNKLLDQIKSNKDPELAVLKNNKTLNFAPNFGNDLKKLQIELAKYNEFEKLFSNLEKLIKPAKEINTQNISNLIKNSGIFLEAKLNHSLKEQNLPQSFFNLLNAIKSTSNNTLKQDIIKLDLKNLDTINTLKELIYVLQNHKKDNKISLENTNYKTLFKLLDKIENFKNYISKNPNIIDQKKLQNIATNFTKELNKNLALINKELSKPQNIKITNTHILKELSQNIKDLSIFLNKLAKNEDLIPAKNTQNTKDIPENKTNNHTKESKENNTNKAQINQDKTPNTKESNDTEEINNIKESDDTKKANNAKESDLKTQKTKDKNTENTNSTKDTQNLDTKKETPKTQEMQKQEAPKTQETQKNDNFLNQNTRNEVKNPEQEIFKQISNSNLNFKYPDLESLNKELNNVFRKLNEVLKALDLKGYDAKISLNDIKNIEKKLTLSIKDINNITQKSSDEINTQLNQDIKSTLLQVSNLAKQMDNESILNQSNRLIAQLEFNQLLSLANDSLHTFIPFFWDDLEKSNVVFKRGKKDKFYAQINLEFEKLGKINVFLALSNDKYLDINMMIENVNFRKKLYEKAHELKQALAKAGLLSANFFIGDIIKNKFFNQEEYNDLNMGFNTRV